MNDSTGPGLLLALKPSTLLQIEDEPDSESVVTHQGAGDEQAASLVVDMQKWEDRTELLPPRALAPKKPRVAVRRGREPGSTAVAAQSQLSLPALESAPIGPRPVPSADWPPRAVNLTPPPPPSWRPRVTPPVMPAPEPEASQRRLSVSDAPEAADLELHEQLSEDDLLAATEPFFEPKHWRVLAGVSAIMVALAVGYLLGHPDTGAVVVETSPSDATVIIDGHALSGTSPFVQTELTPGAHTMLVKRAGFRDQRALFTVRAGHPTRFVPIRLEPLPVASPVPLLPPVPSELSSLGAEPAHAEPEPQLVFTLPPTTQSTPSAYEPRIETPAGRAGGDISTLKPPPSHKPHVRGPVETATAPAAAASGDGSSAPVAGATGTLRINSRPWAEVYVDDKLIGHTPQYGFPIAAGKHTVSLVNTEQNLKKTVELYVPAGRTVTRLENLTP